MTYIHNCISDFEIAMPFKASIIKFLLFQRGYPGAADECNRSNIYGPTFFPTLTHTLILKDTWVLIVEQMHELGLDTFLKLFRLSANLR